MTLMWSIIISRMICFQNNFHFRHGEGHKIVTLFSCKSWRFFCHQPYFNVSFALMWPNEWFLIFLSHLHAKYHCSLLNLVSFFIGPIKPSCICLRFYLYIWNVIVVSQILFILLASSNLVHYYSWVLLSHCFGVWVTCF